MKYIMEAMYKTARTAYGEFDGLQGAVKVAEAYAAMRGLKAVNAQRYFWANEHESVGVFDSDTGEAVQR